MPAFSVDFTPAAAAGASGSATTRPGSERDLKRLDTAVRLQLLRAAGVLTQDPFPSSGSRIQPLVGITPRHFRLRVGDYRLVYRIEARRVIVVRVAHRREAYR